MTAINIPPIEDECLFNKEDLLNLLQEIEGYRAVDYGEDCAFGRYIADQAIILAHNPTTLYRVLEALFRDEVGKGLRIGFAHKFASQVGADRLDLFRHRINANYYGHR